ncbi:hypothetical protein BDN67DRAFT_1071080, partial [Paxillus ammoniavirescens]
AVLAFLVQVSWVLVIDAHLDRCSKLGEGTTTKTAYHINGLKPESLGCNHDL